MQQRLYRSLARIIVLYLLTGPAVAIAQQPASDTLKLTVSKAEAIFLQKNLSLLANQYNIDINNALVQQAKVWDNPVLNTDQNIYDGKFFRHTTTNGQEYGQVYIQVQQLIRTAGKIKKQTQLAQDNVLSAQAQFNDVMRNLKFILTTDLNNLGELQNTATLYQGEVETLQTLVKGMDAMLKQGDISQKENIRVKSLLFSLQSDYTDDLRQQYDLEKELCSMLQLNDTTWILADTDLSFDQKKIDDLSIGILQDSASHNRPDLNLLQTQDIFQQHNLAYQKALAKPDLTVGVEYDRLSNYIPNYYGLSVSLPLPLFNKNKGNINAAQFAYKQSGVMVKQMQTQVEKDVLAAWQKLINVTSLLTADNASFHTNYDVLMQNMVSSYRQRQVSLLEFIDFFEGYKDTRLKEWQLITTQRNAIAELNFATNQSVIHL